VPVDDTLIDSDALQATLKAVADPIEPLDHNTSAAPAKSNGGKNFLLLKSGIALGAIVLAIIAWRISPVGDLDKAAEIIAEIADRPWAPAAVIGAFIVLGFLAFPVTLLIFSTIAVFGGWSGAVLAGLGAMASAIATYLVGRWLGARYVRRLVGPRINRMRRILSERGVAAVASMRLVPLAPFTVVNLIAGAIELSFLNYVAGTFFGLLPGLLAMSALGQQITELFTAPTVGGMLLLLCFVLIWMLLVLGVQLLIGRYRDPE
jgi:uncharacterized membrane protein YdjX (TVP38/TMEM64 family)